MRLLLRFPFGGGEVPLHLAGKGAKPCSEFIQGHSEKSNVLKLGGKPDVPLGADEQIQGDAPGTRG